ncbi:MULTISPECIES: FdhF/YdeP family oxidoreductase [Pseudanabaena]|uniref:Oxidoreductase alpha (Molybdopterin) subunit n=2 Tax=Pseudanabaena TaxID=1152 RepID=L8N692_9CYAN|nr:MULTISPECIES: FdhF/YdeP family oxidoreductase [Pseudanabaena]ELS33743.1 oxidoreductase alpha (molybdopterin) subunit [Pseudanabaena biceps PCC 7429]MDG3494022.1 FdhF/YdeP family oxidoreductase [Pseudanabaena catenata USMAC16]
MADSTSSETAIANSLGSPKPEMGGGLPVIGYWAEKTLDLKGGLLWKTLLHKSACLSCAWGTGGQKGGFQNEDEENLQRCAKSVEAIASELMEAIPPHFFERFTLAELQNLNSMEADRLGRLSFPVIKRAHRDRYERISWDEVYEIVVRAFQKSPERLASYSSGRSSNEAAYLLQLLMRSLGSNNLADCSDLCHAPSTVGLNQVFGSGTSMVSLGDLKQSDCIVLIGSNAPANHPRLMNELIKLRDRGGKIIIVNPLIEIGLVKFASPAYPIKSLLKGSDIASHYIQPISGSDTAVFLGIQKVLLENNWIDYDFLRQYTEEWEEVIAQVQSLAWEDIIRTCGVSREELEIAAEMIGTSQRVVFAWAMGITQHSNAVDNIFSITNTALLTGNVGKEGAGTMPIRGHSNVQGFGSMGVTIRLKEEIMQALEKLLQRSLSRKMGYDTRALIEASDRSEIDTLLCLGGNIYAANPNLTQAKCALGKIETIIYISTKPNLGHFHGLAQKDTLILPVFARFENPHKTTTESGNNFVRLNDEGASHLSQKEGTELISEVELLAELADRLHGNDVINWRSLQDPQYVRQLIAQTIPNYEKIGEIDATNQEFTIPDRIFHTPKFPTPSGKAKMFVTPLPQLELPDIASFDLPTDTAQVIVLVLGTGRSYSQHNTVVYKDGDYYRGMPHRNCILMNPMDGDRAGFQEHQRVTVKGNAGKMEQVEIIYGQIREGSALMFYPEVNTIFSVPIDERCGTPAFKRVPVAVYS